MTSAANSSLQAISESHFFKWLFFACLILLVAGCSGETAYQRLQGPTMGTGWSVSYAPGPDTPSAEIVRAGLEAELEAVNASMSTYRAESEISTLNQAPLGEAFPLSEAFSEVLMSALAVGEASGGAYDVTVGPLVDLWGFGPGEVAQELPDDKAIQAALNAVGAEYIEVAADGSALTRLAAVTLDFSSIAKGYGVDRLAVRLEMMGVSDYMVEVGGEIRVAGVSPRGDSWRIAIEQPDGRAGIAAAMALVDTAVATSGDYRNFFEYDGRRYSHTIDPRTGYPVDHDLVSVTVLHEKAMMADAWATALTVLGPEEGHAVAQAQGLAVYFISRQGGEFVSAKTTGLESVLIERSAE